MNYHHDVDTRPDGSGPCNEGPVRVLHVFGTLDRGGAETAILNVYRHVDRSRVQFDFVSHRLGPWAYESEILSREGRIYVAPQYHGWNHVSYVRWWQDFFDAMGSSLLCTVTCQELLPSTFLLRSAPV